MRMQGSFIDVLEKINFPEEEVKILEFWDKIDAFQESLRRNADCPKYTFYDGPPFATGLPHYGHIAAGTIKDVVTRYAHQSGFSVERRFGWDCHGLPIEFEIDKSEGIRTKKDVLNIGIAAYNEKCRSIVMRFSSEWRNIVTRVGRWIDFDNDYKTMDLNFMESVWWVFKQLFDKGLVYRSARVMPYSCGCNTVLSNFEANLNYKDTSDPSIYINFPLVNDPNTAIIAWTTTPWTLPTNLALAVNPKLTYVKFQPKNEQRVFIVCEDLLKTVTKQANIKEYSVLEKISGEQLAGLKYEPLFEYFGHLRETGAFTVYTAEFVTNESGTGIVHCAPFGEDDFELFKREKIVSPDNPPDPLDDNGIFTEQAPELEGMYFKEADEKIKTMLKERNRVLAMGAHKHSYPFCWRSETPLIYRPVVSWFIRVEQLKEDLLRNNMDSRWVPAFVQEKRFHNWLQDAKDWCFSRSRFWGNPIPLWVSEDGQEVVCIGSIQELKELSGVSEITDLHRESIDGITIPSKQGKGQLRRIEEVFDCWFESGSMPYAQCHYPFSTTPEEFEKRFPADFIAEGLDQTRGWFYTLLVLGTGIFNQNPFKNLIVNGLVLAKDGTKMSKSKGNFTPPMQIVDKNGADAIRMYLTSSPLVRAEPLKFKDEGVVGIVKEVFLPWFHAYRFFVQNAMRYEQINGTPYKFNPDSLANAANTMDKWITAATQSLIKFVKEEMEAYRLYTVVPRLLKFLNDLTNWYVKLNRKRLKGEQDGVKVALDVLFDSLLNLSVLMAPYTPFITELFYQNLKNGLEDDDISKQDSVHYVRIPSFQAERFQEGIETQVHRMQEVIEEGRKQRDRKKVGLRTPVPWVKVIHRDRRYLDSMAEVIPYIQEELNCLEVLLEEEDISTVNLTCLPNNPVLGGRLGKGFDKNLRTAISSLGHDQILQYENEQSLVVNGVELGPGELLVKRKYKIEDPNLEFGGNDDMIVVMNFLLNDELLQSGIARDFVNKVQKLRKNNGLQITDSVELVIEAASPYFEQMIKDQGDMIRSILKIPVKNLDLLAEGQKVIAEDSMKKDEEVLQFKLYWAN